MPKKKPEKEKHVPPIENIAKAMADLPEGASLIGMQECPCGRALILYIPRPDMVEVKGTGELVPSAHLPWGIVAEFVTEMNQKLSQHVILGLLERLADELGGPSKHDDGQ